MKEDWESKKLGELAEIELGRTPARANSRFWDEKRATGNVWLSIADLLNAEDDIVSDSNEYLSDEGAALCKPVPEGTLLVSFKLTLGRLAFAGRDLFTNEAIAALTIFDERQLSKRFLFWFLQFFDWVKAAESDVKLKGMTLNKAKLKELVVHFPTSLEEQDRIVGVLDEAFAGLATAEAHAERNLQNARALFESQLRSVFTQTSEGAEEERLDRYFEIGSSKRVLKSEWKSEGVPFYRGREITRLAADGFVNNELFISEEQFAELSKQSGVPKPGDIVITAIGTIGNAHIVHGDDRFYFKDASVLWMKRRFDVSSEFIRFWLKSPLFFEQLDRGNGATVDTLTIQKLQSLRVRVPDREEQRRIVAQLRGLAMETEHLESIYRQRFAALTELKRALLHQAFTGAL